MGLDINGGNYYCWACRGPVHYTASRCPHCTSEISGGGSNPNDPGTDVGTMFTLAVMYLLVGVALDTWAADSWFTTLYWLPGQIVKWCFMAVINILAWILGVPGV